MEVFLFFFLKLVNDAMPISGENRGGEEKEEKETMSSVLENKQEKEIMLDAQIEISFVPRSQRQFTTTSNNNNNNNKEEAEQQESDIPDTIVVVGKKRKRARNRKQKLTDTAQDQTAQTTQTTKEGAGARGGEEMFDFMAVSNILDDEHDHELDPDVRRPLKKQKQKQQQKQQQQQQQQQKQKQKQKQKQAKAKGKAKGEA